MKAKIYYAAISVFVIAALICSFMLPRRDLRATGQVAGIALDEEGGLIKATFELYTPQLDEPIGRTRQTVVTTGSSLEECITNARLIRGESLFVNDAAALIISSDDHAFLLEKVLEHYGLLKNDQMALPVFFAFGQEAGKIFSGDGRVLSADLAESGKSLDKLQTVRDLMNGTGQRILVRGEGSYEIIS